MKNPNMNLEAKPGMILTAQTQPPKNLNNNNKRRRQSEDEDDEGKGKIAPGKNKGESIVTVVAVVVTKQCTGTYPSPHKLLTTEISAISELFELKFFGDPPLQ